jgi:hypothetical protein
MFAAALYQGTSLLVPKRAQKEQGFSPARIFLSG